ASLLTVPAAFNVIIPLVRGQGVYPRMFIFGLAVAYFLMIEALDFLLLWKRPLAWLAAGTIAAASVVQLIPYYRLQKQGCRKAVDYVNANRQQTDERIGLTLGGKGARFYDPSIFLVDGADALAAWKESARDPTWVIFSFSEQMAEEDPTLLEWVR